MKHKPPAISDSSTLLLEKDLAEADLLMNPTPMMMALRTSRIKRLDRFRDRTSLLVEALDRMSRAVLRMGVEESWAMATLRRAGRRRRNLATLMLSGRREVME